jgi:hypothetical protein
VCFLPDSKTAILFFKTAAFNRSATPPAISLQARCARLQISRVLDAPGVQLRDDFSV